MTGKSDPKTSSPERVERRGVLKKLWLFLGGVALAEGAWVASAFFRPRKPDEGDSRSQVVVAGPIAQFAPGSVTPFQEGKFYLVRLTEGGFLALSRKCTHLGCTVPWDKSAERFVCPCHTSSFDIKGEVLSAPAPRPLDRFAVRIENKVVKVDLSAPIRRTGFSPDEVVK